MTQLCRTALKEFIGNSKNAHPGLLLSRGMVEMPEEGKKKKDHIEKLTGMGPSDLYKKALERWEKITTDNGRFGRCEAALSGRLYIGVSRDNALETGVTVSHTYGMPMIPGSAVKGLCRASAKEWEMDSDIRRWIFGNEQGEGEAEAGGLIFHDAWWVPGNGQGDRPFVLETVTPHHQEYYGSLGEKPATDFDSPIPAPQIAVQGSFYFVVEGTQVVTGLAVSLLKKALSERGIGGKRSSGYGFFNGSKDIANV